jgi:hypothetical protein
MQMLIYTSVYTANETLAMFVQHLHRPWAALLKQGSDAVAHLMAHVVALRAAFSFWASADRDQTSLLYIQHLNYKSLSPCEIEYNSLILMFCARPLPRDTYHLSQNAVSCCLCHQHGIPTTLVLCQTRILAHTEHQDQRKRCCYGVVAVTDERASDIGRSGFQPSGGRRADTMRNAHEP